MPSKPLTVEEVDTLEYRLGGACFIAPEAIARLVADWRRKEAALQSLLDSPSHEYLGACPDSLQPNALDADCEACRRIRDARAALAPKE